LKRNPRERMGPSTTVERVFLPTQRRVATTLSD
jgi:hypothetical protein